MKTKSNLDFLKLAMLLPLLISAGDVFAVGDPWVPPIGIPAPPFGINEQAPATPNPWTDPVPGFYYVEASHPSSTDAANAYGTPSKPRKTIPGREWEPLPAGSVVEVHGRYDMDLSAPSFFGSGTLTKPIFVRGVGAASKPLLTGVVEVLGSSYVIFENLKFCDRDGDLSGGPCGSFGITDKNSQKYDSHHIVLRYCEQSGNLTGGGTGIGGYAPTSVMSNIVFYKNYIHDNGSLALAGDQDCHGIGVHGNTNHVWIIDNEMARNSGDGLQINGFGMADPSLLNHIYVGRNVSHHNKQTGMWTKTASDVIFSQNTVYSHRPSDSSPGQGMGLQCDPERVWFIYNHCYDNVYGIDCGGDQHVPPFGLNCYIVGNVVRNIHEFGANTGTSAYSTCGIRVLGLTNRYVINNTIYDVDNGINTGTSLPHYLYNNIISNASGNHIFIENPTTWELKNCLVYQNGGPVRINIGGSVYTLPQLKSAFSKVQGCLTADPLFVNAAGGDFHLQATSPAVDAGIEASVYATFQSLYGLSIAVDFAKTVRPQGAACEIGAYELGGPAIEKLSAPGSPKVDVLPRN